MSSREARQGGSDSGDGKHLADILPIDRAAIESLSWELGSRVTSGGTSRLFAAGNRTTGSMLTVFKATDHTCIVQFRTPVGREKYFGVAADDLRPMLERLLDRGDWRSRDGRIENV
ncbi:MULTISPECIES: hypothetical protein [unclassified Halorhabdus]|uniref:hypothetical protein n=1 Tax=unclassified Halorhabdus TaxID=2621901 RepID=UPI0023DC55FF|nr:MULTISPECIES: hypothetical protein [unclassified Halorhabdus]WEL16369.1 Uncharacterized protein SVXHr_0184 [Halorhabdus sp. SVX81]WEL20255.1 Uncharacterized protein HBNXHr_0176 [Halorhabdus sp. BNX81]